MSRDCKKIFWPWKKYFSPYGIRAETEKASCYDEISPAKSDVMGKLFRCHFSRDLNWACNLVAIRFEFDATFFIRISLFDNFRFKKKKIKKQKKQKNPRKLNVRKRMSRFFLSFFLRKMFYYLRTRFARL